MQIGIIGVGMVGGTLQKWFIENTNHSLKLYDPLKNYKDDLKNSDAIFICVPVPATELGQDLSFVYKALSIAKDNSDRIFIRSTVLPGTNDSLLTSSMPEFLTARYAYEDMCKLPILVGAADFEFVKEMFTDKEGKNKEIIQVTNKEAEIAKLTHNCYGALKVTYFNFINKLCDFYKADYDKMLKAANITGFIESQHTQVPGHDGKYGFGGTCFPENIKAIHGHIKLLNEHKSVRQKFNTEDLFFNTIKELNQEYRKRK